MPFPRRILPTSQPYITKAEYDAKVSELERKIEEFKQSISVTVEQIDFPDWTKLTSLKANTTYTFDTNGYLLVGTSGGNGNRWIETTINGQKIRWNGDYGSYKYGWGCMQLYIPIRRNINFTFKVSQSLPYAYFLAC